MKFVGNLSYKKAGAYASSYAYHLYYYSSNRSQVQEVVRLGAIKK